MKAAVIVLAGGKGVRMGSQMPKQFLELNHKRIAQYSLDVFDQVAAIKQIVMVADSSFHTFFPDRNLALPGLRRQDSVWNGLQLIDKNIDLICIHDAARPFITKKMVENVLDAAFKTGAAAVGMPLKYTVKEVNAENFVKITLDRSKIWEIQTPQVLRRDLLEKGFAIAIKKNLTVTDDVSLVELFDYPVQLVEGSHYNLKLTTFEDLDFAEVISKKYDQKP